MAKLEHAREATILEASLTVFSRYGYKRTRMEDIAEAAGVSRAIIYQHFDNKEHIFRMLTEQVHGRALAAAKAAFEKQGPFRKRLTQALLDRNGLLLEVGHGGPHADEISAVYHEISEDITVRFDKAMTALVTDEINEALEEGLFLLPPPIQQVKDLVLLLQLGLEGIKSHDRNRKKFETLAMPMMELLLGPHP